MQVGSGNENTKYLMDNFKAHLEAKSDEDILVMMVDKKSGPDLQDNTLFCDILSSVSPYKCTLKLNGLASDEMDKIAKDLASGFLSLVTGDKTIDNVPGLGLEITRLAGSSILEGYTCFYASNFDNSIFDDVLDVNIKKYERKKQGF